MKRLLFILILLLPVIVSAQEDTLLEYGDSLTGEITNQNFEAVYTFEGQKDDVVVITMTSTSPDSTLDPYLSLLTLENQVVSQNDDFFDLNARVIARLPETATYQIIATRLGGRTGEGEGPFDLTLDIVPATESDITLEGTASPTGEPPTHVFILESPGTYTVTYTLTEGSYFPALILEKVNAEDFYNEEVASLTAKGLTGASLTLELEADALYVLSLQDYFFSEGATEAAYTITVEPQGE